MRRDPVPTPIPTVASTLVLEALRELAPREVPVMEPQITPFVEMAAGGRPLSLEVLEGEGRFGDGEILTVALVPLVVEALIRGTAVTPERVEEVARRTNSAAAEQRSTEIARCVEEILQRHRHPDVPPTA